MLQTENNQLRMLIKQYLDGISVNNDVLEHSNPLLVVNNRTNVRYAFELRTNKQTKKIVYILTDFYFYFLPIG